MLSKEERLEYCKYCTHSQKDEDGKWLCELTQQKPSFEYVCYNYNEKESRTKDIKENVEDEIRWYNGKVDYQQLNWNELEPEKEEMFCPGKETIDRKQLKYLRLNYFHTSHECIATDEFVDYMNPYKTSVRDVPSREIINDTQYRK